MKQILRAMICLLLGMNAAQYTYGQWYTTYYWPKQELEQRYQKATTYKERIEALIALNRYTEAHDPVGGREVLYADSLLLAVAEESGDPHLILLAKFAHLRNNSLGISNEERLNHLKNSFVFARRHNLYAWMAMAKAGEARSMQPPRYKMTDVEQTFEQAIEWAEKDQARDSIQALVHLSWSNYYSNQTETVKALRKLYKAIDYARKVNNNELLYQVYVELREYYHDVNKLEEAEQVAREMLMILEKTPNRQYSMLYAWALLARTQLMKKEWPQAKITIAKLFAKADSLQVSPAGRANLIGVIGAGVRNGDNVEMLRWFMSKYLGNFFQTPLVAFLDNYFVANLYLSIGNKDSAKYYLNKATVLFPTALNNIQRGDYYEVCMRTEKAFLNEERAKLYADSVLSMALKSNRLQKAAQIADSLRSYYLRKREIDGIVRYSSLKDSLTDELNKATAADQLAAEEANALERERVFMAEQAAKEKQSRHNLQLLGISFGIVLVFILLAVMGAFKVSAKTIRIVGFFSFLLFFEFIFLVFKKKIYVITQGEPWMDLAFMIALAAILVPLHHWLEHKVVHYLSHKRPGMHLLKKQEVMLKATEE